jgi:hypothetical protein
VRYRGLSSTDARRGVRRALEAPSAANSFESIGTPSYFILDSRGTIRFDQRDLATVVRNATLLVAESSKAN